MDHKIRFPVRKLQESHLWPLQTPRDPRWDPRSIICCCSFPMLETHLKGCGEKSRVLTSNSEGEQWVSLVLPAAAKSLQSCPTLCDPRDGSPPGSPIPGILQARTLEWVAISFSNAWKWKVKVKFLSHVWPSPTSWTAAFQAPLSMGFSRQEYWSGLPLPSPVCIYTHTHIYI